MAQNAINNTIGTASDATSLSQIRNAAGQWVSYNDQTDSFGLYNSSGSPEGVITANTGSLAMDTSNGPLYYKVGDSSNTGWNSMHSNFTFLANNTRGAVTAGEIIIDLTIGPSLQMFFVNVLTATNNGDSVLMQISNDGGSTYANTGYEAGMHGFAYNSATVNNVNSTTHIPLLPNVNTAGLGNYGNGIFYLDMNAHPAAFWGQVTLYSTALGTYSSWTIGALGPSAITQPYTNLRVFGGSSALLFGNIRQYGINPS